MSKSLIQNSRIIAKKGTYQGREVLAFFAVVEGEDGYSVRLVGVRQLDAENAVAVALPAPKTENAGVISIVSPYFPSIESIASNFSFLTSQPARAPSL
jgi:hypothetical protein